MAKKDNEFKEIARGYGNLIIELHNCLVALYLTYDLTESDIAKCKAILNKSNGLLEINARKVRNG